MAFMAVATMVVATMVVATSIIDSSRFVTSIIDSSRQGERRRDEYAVLDFTSHVSLGAARTKTNFVG